MVSSRAGVVSSFTIIKGSMIEETYAVMRDWDFTRTREENLRDVRDNNTIGASSANWLRDVYKVLHRRFDPDHADRPLALLAKHGISLDVWKPIQLWHMTRDEFLLIANAMILPEELIHRTRTTIGPGSVAFMGALRVGPGDRIRADAVFQDELQRRIAERIRPGAASKSGLAGWFTRAWKVDLEETSLSDEAGDRESFLDEALADLDDSPWAQVIARATPREATAARSRAPAPGPKITANDTAKSTAPIPGTVAALPQSAAPIPESVAALPQSAAPIPETAIAKPLSAAPVPKAATPEPEASAPSPKRRRFPGLPPESPLAEIEFGMRHDEVRRILGAPDDKINRFTAKAWIPFYTGPGAYLRDWIYEGEGRVVFSLDDGALEVIDVVYDPDARK